MVVVIVDIGWGGQQVNRLWKPVDGLTLRIPLLEWW